MTYRTCFIAGVCLGCLCGGILLLIPAAPAADETKPADLRIGITQSMNRDTPESQVEVALRPFKAMLEKETGLTGEVVQLADADKLGEQLAGGKVQLGIFQGIEFAWARQKNPKLQPLLICVNQGTHLTANVVVRADSTAKAVGDLHGQDIALPLGSRDHCRLFLQRRCVKPDETPEKSFRKLTSPATAEDALDDVVDGVVQSAVIDGGALDAYKANKPGRFRKLKVLLQSEPFPCGIVACYPDTLKGETLTRIKTCLLNAGKSKQGKDFFEMCHFTHFEAIPKNYEELFKDAAKAYPPAPSN
jgi:ABC-type phosphate/phosphonate transport system substrate-binding protein